MRRWEYCRVSWDLHTAPAGATTEKLRESGITTGTIVQSGNGISMFQRGFLLHHGAEPQEITTNFDDILNELGQDGWELVSHTSNVSNDPQYLQVDNLIFKREIEPLKQPIPPRPSSYSQPG